MRVKCALDALFVYKCWWNWWFKWSNENRLDGGDDWLISTRKIDCRREIIGKMQRNKQIEGIIIWSSTTMRTMNLSSDCNYLIAIMHAHKIENNPCCAARIHREQKACIHCIASTSANDRGRERERERGRRVVITDRQAMPRSSLLNYALAYAQVLLAIWGAVCSHNSIQTLKIMRFGHRMHIMPLLANEFVLNTS